MNTLGDMAKALNRSPVYLHGLQARFELPVFEGAGYSSAYLEFLRTVVFLRVLNVSESSLRDLWHLEKKLLQLLHVDSTGSKTWFLDSCGQAGHSERRLLLTNHDLGVSLRSQTLQLGLNFADSLPELFAGREMGEDALRVLGEYLKDFTRIQTEMNAEVRIARAAARWAGQLKRSEKSCD